MLMKVMRRPGLGRGGNVSCQDLPHSGGYESMADVGKYGALEEVWD